MKGNKKNSTGPSAKRRGWFKVALLILSLSVLFTALAGFIYIRFGLSGDFLANRLFKGIGKSSGARINISSAELSWRDMDSGSLSINGLRMSLPVVGAEIDIRAENVTVSFDMLSFFTGRATLSNGAINRANITVKKAPRPLTKTRPQENRRSWGQMIIRPLVKSMEIRDSSIILQAPGRTDGQDQTLLTGLNGQLKNLTLDKCEKLVLEGIIKEAKKTGQFSAEAQIENFGGFGSNFKASGKVNLEDYPAKKLKSVMNFYGRTSPLIEGGIDLNLDFSLAHSSITIDGDLIIRQALISAPEHYFADAPLSGLRMSFAAKIRPGSVLLEISELAIPGLNTSFDAEFAELNEEELAASITVNAAAIDLAKVFPLTPMKVISPRDRKNLIEAGLDGRILIRGGAWSGRIRGFPDSPEFSGSLALAAVMDNVSGFAPGFDAPVKNASGGIDLNADEAKFTDVRLTIGESPMVLNGWINDLRSSPSCNLFVSLAAIGKDLDPLLKTMEILDFTPQWTQKIRDPEGGLSMRLRLIGPLNNPVLKGNVEVAKFGCKLKGTPLALKDLSGTVKFEEAGVSRSQLSGRLGSSKFKVSGSAALRNMDLKVNALIESRDLKRLNLVPGNMIIQRGAPLLLSLKGEIQHLAYEAKVNLKNNLIVIGSYLKKNSGAELRLEASGEYKDQRAEIEEAYLISKDARVSAEGSVDINGLFYLDVHLPPKGLPTGALRPFVHPDLDLRPGGRIDGNASIKYSPNSRRGLEVNSDIILNYVSAFPPIFYKPVKGFTGRIRLRDDTLNLTIDKCSLGKSEIRGLISVRGLKRPVLGGKIELPHMDFSDFLAPPGYEAEETWGEWLANNSAIKLLSRSMGAVNLFVEEGDYYGHNFSDLRAKYVFKNGMVKVEDWTADFAGGDLTGDALFNITGKSNIPIRIDFKGEYMNLSTLLLTDPERVSVKGRTRASGRMEWRLTKDKSVNNGMYYAGNVYMRARDGVIYRFEILSKIFSLLNLGSILSGRLPDILANGLPYKTMSWRMDLFNDKWKINDFDLISDAARITASGMYIASEGRVDFLVKVSPLVGFDKIFSGIFGDLITKDGKILTTTFRVRGLAASPDVRLESTAPFGIEP